MKPLVSVIIPTFNHGPVIADAIKSCLQQTFINIEIIIIDDGSTDNTKEILKPYTKIRSIKYYYQENRGLSAARNKGLIKSRGKFIQFLDADDILLPNKLELQTDILQKESLNSVHSEFFIADGPTNKQKEKHVSSNTEKDRFLSDLVIKWEFDFSIPCHCFLFRKSSLNGLWFNPRLHTHEDWEFYVRWAAQGNWSKYLDQELCIYRIFPKSMSRNMDKMSEGYDLALSYMAKCNDECRKLVDIRIENDITRKCYSKL